MTRTRTLVGLFAIVVAASAMTAGAAVAAARIPTGHWRQVSIQKFSGADAELRSQGMADDGHNLFFSYQLGLMRTTRDPFAIQAINPYAIPLDLVLRGSNPHKRATVELRPSAATRVRA